MTRKISKNITLKTELIIKNNGQLSGLILRATNKSGYELIDKLMSGEVSGLEYCKDKKIRPVAGGYGTYFLKVSQI